MWRINTLSALLATILFCNLVLVSANGVFELKDTYVGSSFFDGFDYVTFDDPTHGRVVSSPSALSLLVLILVQELCVPADRGSKQSVLQYVVQFTGNCSIIYSFQLPTTI